MELEIPILAPEILPEPPDGLVQGARKWHRGVQKVVVSLFVARNKYRDLNTIRIMAQPDTPPTEAPEAIARAVMAVAQTHYEETDTPAKYRAQFYVAPKSTGDTMRKSCHFELGDGSVVGDAPDPGRVDDLLLGHVRECHTKILEQADRIAELGRVALEQVGTSFVRTNEALEAKADAIMTANAARFEEKQAEQKAKTTKEVLEILKMAANEAAKQFAAHRAGKGQGDAAAGTVTQENPVKAAAVAGVQTMLGGAEPVTPPAVAAAPAAPPISSPAEDEKDPEHPQAFVARTFGETLTHDQWFAVFETFTKAQIAHLKSATHAQTDDEALAAVGALRDSMKPAQQAKLIKVLESEQQTMIISLLTAAPKVSDDSDDD